ncbi:MAG: hypothetical protein RL375_4122, partial [Pseudomonadota bacterium]
MTQDIKARLSLDGAPAFASQGKAAADSLGEIVKQLQRIAINGDDLAKITNSVATMATGVQASGAALEQMAGRIQSVADTADRAGGSLRNLFVGGLGVAGLIAAKDAIVNLGSEILQTAVRAETLQSGLRFAV